MNETKQQVFNAAVEKAVGMTLVAGYTSYGDKYREDMRARYAAATDGDTEAVGEGLMIYVIKNEADKYLSFSDDGDPVWDKYFGHFETSKQQALTWSRIYGGTVVCYLANSHLKA